MLRDVNVFRKKVQAHIIDNLGYPWDEENQCENRNATIAERLQNVVDEFDRWYDSYERRRNPFKGNAFFDFLHSLPNCLSTVYTYYDERKTLQGWYEWTDEEAQKCSIEQVEFVYYSAIHMQFRELCRMHKVKF
jgi:hypothetical protein